MLIYVLFTAAVFVSTCPAFGAADGDVMAKLRPVAGKYGLKTEAKDEGFQVTTVHGLIEGAAAPEKALENYVPILAFELDLYPVQLVERAGLKRVVLCTKLSFDHHARAAIPDIEHGTLYLDVSQERHSGTYTRAVIHHEFFHMVDWADDWKLYSDPSWAALNRPGFTYGAGGAKAQDDARGSVLGHAPAGFINAYSTSGVEEDKAELFAHMIVSHLFVAKRAERDEIIARKAAQMVALLESFSPETDGRFWNRVRKAKRMKDRGDADRRDRPLPRE